MSFEVVDLGTFARQWAVQSSKIGWLLGAGASATAGVPTAHHIMLDLLLGMYADAHHLVRQTLSLAESKDVDRIREYYDSRNGMPPFDDPAAYSVAFQLALPDEGARRQYLRRKIGNCLPSYGQRILGAFVAAGLTDLIATTNFDDLIEKAAERAQVILDDTSRPRLGVAALGNPVRAILSLSDGDFPFLVKLHGDFRERDLKNLESELQAQDANMRQSVLDASRRFGLAVIGYSGRDESVMEMLSAAIRTDGAFPAGLWWMGRDPSTALAPVRELLHACADKGVRAYFVKIETFDETMGALGRQAWLPDALREYVDELGPDRRVVDGAIPHLDRGVLPVLRMNALPVVEAPRHALRATLRDIPERDVLRNTLHEGAWRGALALSGRQVLALGSASLLAKLLDLDNPPSIYDIDPAAEHAPSQERALIYEALTRGIARQLPVKPRIRDAGHRLIVVPENPERADTTEHAEARARLQAAYEDPLTGECPVKLGRGTDGRPRRFAEAVELSLDWRLGVLWLLFVPRTWVSPPSSESIKRGSQADPASAWRKERWVDRRNERWAAIIGAWATSIAPKARTEISVLPYGLETSDMIAGSFTLGGTTAYSREAR